jgi:hypothetical protein
MPRNKYADQVRAADTRLAQERREPGIKPPGQSEFGVVARRYAENPPRPEGTRYRPKAASLSVAKPEPYWHMSGELVYPD